jgi:2-phosphoglycerate kinase
LKTVVHNTREGTRVPFLRGILTRSLLDAGMSFEDAFDLATEIRKDLSSRTTITNEELRGLVIDKLDTLGDEGALHAYRQPVAGPGRILVVSRNGARTAFSRGRLERFLQASGLASADAEDVTAKVFDQLLIHGADSISTTRLGLLTYLCLRHEIGRKAGTRFLLWSEFQRSERPLALMIGGAVGAGKSSLATEVAHRLEIVRTQSTDMLREVMRTMIPQQLLPVLHVSSFEAWETLPIRDKKNRALDELVAEGFRSQAQLLEVPCKAVLQRAEAEGVSMILEGVHVLPNLTAAATPSIAIRVHVTLAVLQSSALQTRLRGRGSQTPKRHARKYLEKFDSIWSLQSFLLSEADRNETAIVTNDDLEKAVHQVIVTINRELSKHFKGRPEEAFGNTASEAGLDLEAVDWRDAVPALISR